MFSQVLKELRESRGLSRSALAAELNVSRSLISMYESGERRPSFEMLEALSDYFEVSMSELCDRDISTEDAENELWEIRETLRRRPEMRVLFSMGKDASAEEINQTIAIIDALKKTKS